MRSGLVDAVVAFSIGFVPPGIPTSDVVFLHGFMCIFMMFLLQSFFYRFDGGNVATAAAAALTAAVAVDTVDVLGRFCHLVSFEANVIANLQLLIFGLSPRISEV